MSNGKVAGNVYDIKKTSRANEWMLGIRGGVCFVNITKEGKITINDEEKYIFEGDYIVSIVELNNNVIAASNYS